MQSKPIFMVRFLAKPVFPLAWFTIIYHLLQSKSIFKVGFFTNRVFLLAVVGSLVGQMLVIYFPPLQAIFQTEALYVSGLYTQFVWTPSLLVHFVKTLALFTPTSLQPSQFTPAPVYTKFGLHPPLCKPSAVTTNSIYTHHCKPSAVNPAHFMPTTV